MYPKYKITVWHGEHSSLFEVVRYWENDEDWEVVFSANNRHSAESWVAQNVGFGDYTGTRGDAHA